MLKTTYLDNGNFNMSLRAKRSNLKVLQGRQKEIASSQAPRNDNVLGGNLPLSTYTRIKNDNTIQIYLIKKDIGYRFHAFFGESGDPPLPKQGGL